MPALTAIGVEWHDTAAIGAFAVFFLTYLFIAVGKLPGYHIDRAGAALLGASCMVWLGILSLEDAYQAIDFNTLALLLGMMIVVANLRLGGFFRLINEWIIRRTRYPIILLITIVVVSGTLSAFLVNDTICLVMTPLVLELAIRLKRNPIPYLLAVAVSSNIGSTATITGNPQNMIIGNFSGIAYRDFSAALSPIAAIGLILAILLITVIHHKEFLSREAFTLPTHTPVRHHQPVVIKSLLVTAAMVALFFAGQPIAKVAIAGGALMLFTRRIKAHKIYREIDWPLLLMFSGLFVVVAGFERVALTPEVVAAVTRQHLDNPGVLSLVTATLSNLVSNVPAVLILKPFVSNLNDPQRAWTIIAMSSTLAGNLTLIGSVANLIVAQRAQSAGITIGFWAYFKVGAPLTVLTILLGVCWI